LKKTYHFISHTHWDREWYLPFEQFRYRLVRLIDRLLDLLDQDPHFSYFHLDGQTIVLEDYAALRPNNMERLERYLKKGRILIGPWYQQNDLYLTSGESTVRNLIEGIHRSRLSGGEMKVGYLPDHFGLMGQMPQIFRGVGLKHALFGRGYDLSKHRSPHFYWQSPDGSTVTGLMMYHWYNNAQRLPSDDTQLFSLFDTVREREERVNDSPHHAMMNGVDHLEAQYDLSTILEKLSAHYGDEITVVHTTMPHYTEAISQYMSEQPEGSFETITGELREGHEYEILAGTLSSRMYIKQANMQCHDIIEKWLEPLSAWCSLLDLERYDSDAMQYIWKLYMENHPHDSICGCSQDAVHDHMMDRYQRIHEIGEDIINAKLTLLARQVDNSTFDHQDLKLLVANTSQLPASPVIQSTVYFIASDQVEDFVILDEAGSEVSYRVLSARPTRYYVTSSINLPGDLKLHRFDIEWQPLVPALGYATYRVRPMTKGRKLVEQYVGGHTDGGAVVLENEYMRAELQPDGSFHLLDKVSGKKRYNQGQFRDDGDRGTLYQFSKTEGEAAGEIWNRHVELVAVSTCELYQECSYRFAWDLPAQLNEDRKTRSERTVACVFQVRLRLERGARQLNMNIEIDNQAKDHRIRLLFPDVVPDEIWSGSQFDIVQRPWDSGSEWDRDANNQPFWKWFAPISDENGLSIFTKGQHEYEMMDQGRCAGVTLLRGVETINTREEVYLEQDVQPKGQCLGNITAELAVRPFTITENGKSDMGVRLYQEAEQFHQGLRTKLLAVDEARWNEGRAWVQASMHTGVFTETDANVTKAKLPLVQSVLSLESNVMLSAIKKAEDQQGIICRLFNPGHAQESATLQLPVTIDHAMLTNLLEETIEPLNPDYNAITVEAGPHAIKTFRIIANTAQNT